MSAWGQGGAAKSCDRLLRRVEQDDPSLVDLVILPMKTFGASEVDRLSDAIAKGANTNLRSISASGHAVPPPSLQKLGSAISSQAERDPKSGITSVAIGSRHMGDDGTVAFCDGLEASDGGLLQYVDLAWKEIRKTGLQHLGRTFAASTNLLHLNLSRNEGIGDEGICSFCDAAVQKQPGSFQSLEELDFSECSIGHIGANALSEHLLARSAACSTKPLKLSLHSNPIGVRGCAALSSLCAGSTGSILLTLSLSKCSVGDEGVKILAMAAKTKSCTGLTVLDLSENGIGVSGANYLGDSLSSSCWPSLLELCLAKNDLLAEGTTSITRALSQRGDLEIDAAEENSVLKTLDLSRTKCDVDGALAALKCGRLSRLRLFDNQLGSAGFEALATLLRGGHPSLENLDLGGNSAKEAAMAELLRALLVKNDEFTSHLHVLEIGGNEVGSEVQSILEELKNARPELDIACDRPKSQPHPSGL